ncbi:MAG: UDP-N-acetylglucosamine--N-acetylmuramyl-(pentapeptide) pyrophosphoryl-undecaprenol N-acetylglucosamine transferase [Kouleothrix sp.]|nr:UDP-N-acetylglucosamine--N-acetylmuramyl-(pentapeptide) pyrophosphoryl-undecaprenol N-acetylglucosamine transferase [Kouleothrix sp.]
MRTIKIMVTGGGSSGHVSPALAIISVLRELAQGAGWQPRLRYIGGRRGIERRLVEAAGVDFVGIATGKLRRYFDLENLTDMLRIPLGVGQALAEVRRFRPDVLLSTGGYVGVPPVVAAWLQRVPVLTHEQTVQIGLANRITARLATTIALSFESAAAELPPRLRRRAIVTGNPVRPQIFGGDRAEAIRLAGFSHDDDGLPVIYVTGGSQGARIINRAVEAALPELLALSRVIHQCGQQPAGEEQDYDRLARASAQLPAELRRRYHLTRFVGDEIRHVFALADLVVGRAGAGTLAEICVLGKPALYIPLVPTGGDEQTRNARACAAAGAATIIPQAELSGPRLVAELAPLLADRPRLAAMGRAASTLGKPNAARDVAREVLRLAGEFECEDKA